jgi:O-antigen/teichoic acid export membrane protein
LGMLARAAVGPVERLLNMLGQQILCACVYAGTFILNLCICFALIPLYGMAGAAISTSIALIVESVALYTVARSQLGFHAFVLKSPFGKLAAAVK